MKKQLLYLCFVASLGFTACGESEKEQPAANGHSDTARAADTVTRTATAPARDTSALEKNIINAGLVDIETVVPGIFVDLRYSTEKNFMGRDLYGTLERVYVQPDVALKVKKAQELLKSIDSNLSILIFDGVRPLSIQKQMWDEVKLPAWKKGKFLSNPAYGSIHNYGAAVDISLCTVSGQELDMGTPYDDTATLAYPTLEAHFVAQGRLSKQQVKNRQLLRRIMYSSGFFGIQTEWWHFNACTRDAARSRYRLVE